MDSVFVDKSTCCGCSACMNVCAQEAITMKEDTCGFIYPTIDINKCVDCGLCKAICDFQKGDGVEMRLPLKSFAAVHNNKRELELSASGGAFYSIAQYIRGEGGFIFGCVYDNNLNPVHICAENEMDLCRMQSSKYIQSRTDYVYREVFEKLNTGKPVLFSGTPCQVAALLSYLGKRKYENLLTIDLICHGTPNASVWQQHLKYLEHKYRGQIVSVNFRSKKQGWGEMMLELGFENGKKKYLVAFEDCYYRNFLQGNLNRPSAFTCKYATEKRVSDITIGDFWGDYKSDYHLDPTSGMSICLVNTEKGLDYLNKSSLKTEEIPIQYAIAGNEQLRESARKGVDWDICMELLEHRRYERIVEIHQSKYKTIILKSRIKRLIPRGIMRIIRIGLNKVR